MKKNKTTDKLELRRKAEEQFKDKKSTTSIPPNSLDLDRLVQELQIHQIELEMQNEELKKARDTAESLSTKYAELYDLAPTGYFTFDKHGIIDELNIVGSIMLGVPRSRAVGSHFTSYVSPNTKKTFTSFLDFVFESMEKSECEVLLNNNKGTRVIVNIEGVFCEESQKINAVVIDVTKHREVEEKYF